jgi:hypothetical protein
MMLPRTLCLASCCEGIASTLDLGHKPCAVSRRKFRQREAFWLPHLSHQLIYITVSSSFLSFSSFEIAEPVLKVLIYFLVIAPAPGNA